MSLRFLAGFLALSFALPFSAYAAEETPPNILLLCVDDLRPELGSFGAEHIDSPNIDALAARGARFPRHYVQAPTCGASRYTLLTGRYGPSSNHALFQRAERIAEDPAQVPPSMPDWFRQHGYTTVSVGKVSHHPGGKGGRDWNDPAIPEMPRSWDRALLPSGPWQHPRGWMHGLANGEIRKDAKDMDLFQALPGPDSIYPDGPGNETALEQLRKLSAGAEEGTPFFLAVGILRPHLPFGAPKKYLDRYEGVEFPPIPHPEKPSGKTTWHGSGEFMKYNRWGKDPRKDPAFALEVRKHYAACVSYADAQAGKVLDLLDELGRDRDTIVVLWGDHGWHLGEHAVWGKHTLFEESLRAPLILSVPGLDAAGHREDSLVETLDLFPTLAEAAGLPEPDSVQGRSLLPMLRGEAAEKRPAIAYHRRGMKTIRTETHRLIEHKGGHVELYDHRTPEAETRNVAEEHPELVRELRKRIAERLGKTE